MPLGRTAEFLALVPARGPDRADLAVPGAQHRSRRGRSTRCSRARPTSTSASGRACPRDPSGEPEARPTGSSSEQVTALDGHKSLYSDAYYDEDQFWRLYGGDTYAALKQRYDPESRLLDLYAKAVQRK